MYNSRRSLDTNCCWFTPKLQDPLGFRRSFTKWLISHYWLKITSGREEGVGGVGCLGGGGACNVGREGAVLKCIAVYCAVKYTGSVLQLYTCTCVDLYV